MCSTFLIANLFVDFINFMFIISGAHASILRCIQKKSEIPKQFTIMTENLHQIMSNLVNG